MAENTVHNLDRYMIDLRHILTKSRKKIGLLIGAGGPVSIKVPIDDTQNSAHKPLIPAIAELTREVIERLDVNESKIIAALSKRFGFEPTIEDLLTKVRRISEVLDDSQMHGFAQSDYEKLATKICSEIGDIVGKNLPEGDNPYSLLVSWIGGIHRNQPVEIFTPNYDLLFEEAFERNRSPYFDGFSGSFHPFFDPASVRSNDFPDYWSRLWKIHGSLGWSDRNGKIVRTGNKRESNLIYPDHRKYDEISKQPFSALFERLRTFLTSPDSLLLCCGFSFFDTHITSVLDEALSENTHTAIMAFQFRNLEDEPHATDLAKRRNNFSLYASDGAIIGAVTGKWYQGPPSSEDWSTIRSTFWRHTENPDEGCFTLGDFVKFAKFLSLSNATNFEVAEPDDLENFESSEDYNAKP